MTLLLLFTGGGGLPGGAALGQYRVSVDWDNNGTFATSSNEDITSYVRAVETRTGRDQPGRLRGRCQPGRLVVQLWNTDGIFSRFNAASPLTGKILPRRRVKLEALTPFAETLWTGYLVDVRPSAARDGLPTAVLTAEGPLALISAAVSNTAASTGAKTDVHVHTVLDSIGFSTAERSIASGSVDTSTWYASGESALAALRKLEDTELGLVGELTSAFGVSYEGRSYRGSATRSTVAQSTFSDTASDQLTYQAIDQLDELDEIANKITVQTPDTITAGTSGTLWSYGTDVGTVEITQIAPQSGFSFVAMSSADGFVTWETPTIGSTTNQDVYLVTSTGGAESFGTTGTIANVVKSATSMYFEVLNQEATGSLDIAVKRVRARGTPSTGAAGAAFTAQDSATSQVLYGVRDYALNGGYYPNATAAQAALDLVLARHKDPHAQLAVDVLANKSYQHMQAAVRRRVSDRVTVSANSSRTGLGIAAQDFWVESISHRIDQNGGRHVVRFELGECSTV